MAHQKLKYFVEIMLRKDTYFGVGCNTSKVTCVWLNFQYNHLVILYTLNMNYYKAYGWDIK